MCMEGQAGWRAPCWEVAHQAALPRWTKAGIPHSLPPLLVSRLHTRLFPPPLAPVRGFRWHWTVSEQLGKGIQSTEGQDIIYSHT